MNNNALDMLTSGGKILHLYISTGTANYLLGNYTYIGEIVYLKDKSLF
jgi:hypothetical protein